MKKAYLLLALAITVLSCEKQPENNYYHEYYYSYNLVEDSYEARVSFKPDFYGMPIPLGKKETISFDGRPADISTDIYFKWSGKGNPNASFVLKKNKREIVTPLPKTNLGTYEIIIPETASKTTGFTVKIKGYDTTKGRDVSIQIRNDSMHLSYNMFIQKDSVFVSPQNMMYFPTGRTSIAVVEIGMKDVQANDGDKGIIAGFFDMLSKPMMLTK